MVNFCDCFFAFFTTYTNQVTRCRNHLLDERVPTLAALAFLTFFSSTSGADPFGAVSVMLATEHSTLWRRGDAMA